MRGVVDTNIFVSAALKQASLPGNALYQVEQRCSLLKSVVTEAQFFEVIARPLCCAADPAGNTRLGGPVHGVAELVTITERVAACRDPTDDKFLELAINGHADLILTGDKDLLVLNPFRGIPIVTPRGFMGRQGTA